MTEVSFHFNVPDRTEYVCRLLRKALRQGAKVVVVGPEQILAGLNRAIWTFDAIEFVPHVVVRAGEKVPAQLRDTPVWLTESVADAVHHEVLVNLGQEPPPGFESFARLIEIVTVDEEARLAARQRWKHYSSRGYAIERHEVGQ